MPPLAAALLAAALAGPESGGPRELFDPFSKDFPDSEQRPALKERALEAWLGDGPAARVEILIRALGGCEEALQSVEARVATQLAVYEKALARWEAAREEYRREYRRKHSTDPVDWPIDKSIEKAALDQEQALKRIQTTGLYERLFHAAALEAALRALERLPEAERGKPLAAIQAGLKDRNPFQRLRCADLLRRLPAPDLLAAAASEERDPGIQGAILEGVTTPSLLVEALGSPLWPVRAGAIRGLAALGTPEARSALEAREAKENGRLLLDLHRALGRTIGPDPGILELPLRSTRVVFVLDLSAESKPVLDAAVPAITEAISALPDGGALGLVLFDRTARKWKPRAVASTAAVRQAAIDALARLTSRGEGSNVHGALRAALEVCGGGDGRPAEADTIYYFSGANDPSAGLCILPFVIADEISALARAKGVTIHLLGVSLEKHRDYLGEIARRTGGYLRRVG